MNYITIKNKNYKISRLTLGTVQIGTTYGIDSLGKPSNVEANSILKYALDNGINVIDTSPDYGDSEQIIGNFLNNYNNYNNLEIYVVTKLNCHHYDKNVWENRELIAEKIREDFYLSCKKLKLDKIAIYLVHSAPHAFVENGIVLDILSEIKNEEKIGLVGVSIYTDSQLKKCIEDQRVDVVQIPFNILDRRLLNSGLLEMAKKRGLLVFARSVYLQGLLIMDLERIPNYLKEAVNFIKELRKIAMTNSINLKELCLKYVLSLDTIDSVLIGINSLEQLKENIKIFDSKPLKKEILKAIENLPIPPEYILNPSKWVELKSHVK